MLTLPLACTLIFIVCCGYACLVYALQRIDPGHGLTPFLVVIGNSIIIVFVYLVYGLEFAGGLAALNAVAGIPMVLGYYGWLIPQKRRKRNEF